jgi:hypothetical protein
VFFWKENEKGPQITLITLINADYVCPVLVIRWAFLRARAAVHAVFFTAKPEKYKEVFDFLPSFTSLTSSDFVVKKWDDSTLR